MVVVGMCVPHMDKLVYHYYDVDTEFCTVDVMWFAAVKTVILRRVDRRPVLQLCCSYDTGDDGRGGVLRCIRDMETGEVVATISRSDAGGTVYNDRYLVREDGNTARIWDLEHRDEPVAVFNLSLLKGRSFAGGVDRSSFMCDNEIEQRMQLAFLLYPHVRFV